MVYSFLWKLDGTWNWEQPDKEQIVATTVKKWKIQKHKLIYLTSTKRRSNIRRKSNEETRIGWRATEHKRINVFAMTKVIVQ